MNLNDRIPIIIPAYEPDERLIALMEDLKKRNFTNIIIVNDGSGPAYDAIFAKFDGVLVHEVNKGKGRALKTAFAYILENQPDAIGAVTADSDGQHTPDSIEAVMQGLIDHPDDLIIGARKFGDRTVVPWQNRFANELTARVFAVAAGKYVSDTQTGLRGIPSAFMRELLDVQGERFEFEMRMLLVAAEKMGITEVPIDTVYDSLTNHQSHFNKVKDSFRIYRIILEQFIRYTFVSLSSFVIDLGLFTLFCMWLDDVSDTFYIAMATVLARLLSATYNYLMNYKVVFKSKRKMSGAAVKYVLLALFIMTASAALVTVIKMALPAVNETVIKVAVDAVLFVVSYTVQKKHIF